MGYGQDWMDRVPASEELEKWGSSREATDLRRRRRQDGSEEIVRAAQFLPAAERVLIESVFRDGRRVSDMARLIAGPERFLPADRAHAGPSAGRHRAEAASPGACEAGTARGEPERRECDARALRARVRRVVRRMLTPEYRAVARWFSIEKLNLGGADGAPLSALRRKVAASCFLHGLSIREAAQELGLSLHTVRRHRDAVAALAEVSPAGRAQRGEREGRS